MNENKRKKLHQTKTSKTNSEQFLLSFCVGGVRSFGLDYTVFRLCLDDIILHIKWLDRKTNVGSLSASVGV